MRWLVTTFLHGVDTKVWDDDNSQLKEDNDLLEDHAFCICESWHSQTAFKEELSSQGATNIA